jgi:hypothetical protein
LSLGAGDDLGTVASGLLPQETVLSGLTLPIHCVSLLANFVMCMALKAVLFRTHISVAGALLNTAKVLLHCTAAAVK